MIDAPALPGRAAHLAPPDAPATPLYPCAVPRRQEWGDLPGDVPTAVREHTDPIDRVEHAGSGFSSQIAVTLDTASGRVFVKGMRRDHADAWTQQREAAVNPHVVPLGPRLLWRVTAGGWDLLGFEHLTGRSADYSRGCPKNGGRDLGNSAFTQFNSGLNQ